jgi:hypothetical protein
MVTCCPLVEPDVQISRIRLSWKPSSAALAWCEPQELQTKPLEVRIIAGSLRQLVRALAAMMLQVVGQPIADMPVDLPVRPAWVT